MNKKTTGQTGDDGRKNVEIMVPLKYLSNLQRTIVMPLINCEINFYITWHEKCVIASNTAANQATILTITDRELYFPIVTLSTQGNTELLQQLKSGFKRAIK